MKAMFHIGGWVLLLSGCANLGLEQKPIHASIARHQAIDIAQDDIVRIVTPFAIPRVVTKSDVEIQRSHNVLYVLPDQNEPIAMFVTDGENESDALSLVLTPKESGKREVSFPATVATTPTKKPEPREIRRASKASADEYGKPCRRCRKDDTGGSYDGGSKW